MYINIHKIRHATNVLFYDCAHSCQQLYYPYLVLYHDVRAYTMQCQHFPLLSLFSLLTGDRNELQQLKILEKQLQLCCYHGSCDTMSIDCTHQHSHGSQISICKITYTCTSLAFKSLVFGGKEQTTWHKNEATSFHKF